MIVSRIDDIGYVICDCNGKTKVIDNITASYLMRLQRISNVEEVAGRFNIISRFSKVRASDLGIITLDSTSDKTERYVGKRLKWANPIEQLVTPAQSYRFKDGRMKVNMSALRGVSLDNKYGNYYALCRVINKKFIGYRVYSINDYNTKIVTLDIIHEYANDYVNVSSLNGILRVSALDGVYDYDIDLVHKEYNNNRIDSKEAVKASLLGINYREVLDEQYRLHSIEGGEYIIIPKIAKHIKSNAIKIDNKTIRISFNNGLETCNINCFNKVHYRVHVEEIDIGSGNGRLQVLKALDKNIDILYEGAHINLQGELLPREFAYLIMSPLTIEKKCVIRATPNNSDPEQFVREVVSAITMDKFKNFDLLNSSIEPNVKIEFGRIVDVTDNVKYNKLKMDFRLFKQVYEKILSNSASEVLNNQVNRFIGQIDNTISMRDIELKQKMIQFNKL